jgi:hypothetical protein
MPRHTVLRLNDFRNFVQENNSKTSYCFSIPFTRSASTTRFLNCSHVSPGLIDNRNVSSRFCGGDALLCAARSLGDVLSVFIKLRNFLITNVAA